MKRQRILNVGSCAADHASIERILHRQFGAETVSVATAAEAIEALRSEQWDLVLINRLLDVDASSGLELIRVLKSDPQAAEIPIMLVSNFADAQRDAIELGADPGFGKAALRDAQTTKLLSNFLSLRQD